MTPDPRPDARADSSSGSRADSSPDATAPRPRPRYGEYATPEEVAEARGPLPQDAAGAADPVSRLAAPIEHPPSPRGAATGRRPSPPVRWAPPPRPMAAGARHPRPGNNLITALLLVFGIWNTVGSIPSYLDFGTVLSQGWQAFGYGSVNFGASADTAGIVLLIVSLLLMIAAVVVSLQLIRLGRRSIWVPIAAAALYFLVSLVVMTIVVANTPALADVLHNH